MSKMQSLVELYKGILAALIAQGNTEITRPAVFKMRQMIWSTKGYSLNFMGAADTKALTEATKALGGVELFNVGPKGKRSKVRFVFA
jgi:Flp pilus assembly protein protease CpaA